MEINAVCHRVPGGPLAGRIPFVALLLLVGWLSGCANEQKTLYEHDHVVPGHWPSGLAQCSRFIRERLTLLREGENEQASEELQDLLKWVPQVAGDTDLPESDWNGLNRLSERLQQFFPVDRIDPGSEFDRQIESLLTAMDQAQGMLDAKSLERAGSAMQVNTDEAAIQPSLQMDGDE